MTITQGAYTFESPLHGVPRGPSSWEFDIAEQQYFGVRGAQILVGQSTARTLEVDILLTGYASHAALQSAIASLATQAGLTGSVTIDLGGGDSTEYTNCFFLGYEPAAPGRLDGSGVNGWEQEGKLKWRQLDNQT